MNLVSVSGSELRKHKKSNFQTEGNTDVDNDNDLGMCNVARYFPVD